MAHRRQLSWPLSGSSANRTSGVDRGPLSRRHGVPYTWGIGFRCVAKGRAVATDRSNVARLLNVSRFGVASFLMRVVYPKPWTFGTLRAFKALVQRDVVQGAAQPRLLRHGRRSGAALIRAANHQERTT